MAWSDWIKLSLPSQHRSRPTDFRLSGLLRIEGEPGFLLALNDLFGAAGGIGNWAGVVRSDTLVTSQSPQCISQVWEINEADIQLTDALYPAAQEAMRRGYYLPNRISV